MGELRHASKAVGPRLGAFPLVPRFCPMGAEQQP